MSVSTTPSSALFNPGRLRELVQAAVAEAIESYAAECSVFVLDSANIGVATTVSAEAEWRDALRARYPDQGSWKRSLIDVIPFRRFAPREILRESGEELRRRHPSHNHIPNGVHNVLKWLVDDGVVARIAPGVYSPAINGDTLF